MTEPVKGPGRIVALCLGVITLGVGAGAVWIHRSPVTAAQMTESVARGVGGSGFASECRSEGNGWRCDIDDTEASGNANAYAVRSRGRRCAESNDRTARTC